MTFVWLTFAVTLAIVLGVYWAFVVRPEAQDKDQLTGRLKTFKVKTSNITIANEPSSGQIQVLESLLAATSAGLRRAARAAARRIRPQDDPGRLHAARRFGGHRRRRGDWLVDVAARGRRVILVLLFGFAPLIYVRRQRTKRLQTFEEQFPEAVELIARALRAGHAFTTGLGMAADEVPKPAGPEFRRVYDEQNFGMSLPEALRAMAQRVPVLDARFFVTAVLTQRESGGNLSEVLDNLASVMRERFKVKRQIRVISAHGRLSAWILSCLAPALAGVSVPDVPELHADPLGGSARRPIGAWRPSCCS